MTDRVLSIPLRGAWLPLVAPFVELRRHRLLLYRLVVRDVSLRYKGSVLGFLWSMLNPLALLALFSFVFGVVMHARWGSAQQNFSLVIYSGLILFIFLSDVINKAPTLIVQNDNYVKKVIFPLDVLPAVTVGGALVNLLLAMLILLAGELLLTGALPWTWIFAPLVVLPLLMLVLGVAYFLASLGVYLRDIAQVTGILAMVLMYLSPILYPVDMVPPEYRGWLDLNPLTLPVNELRQVTLQGGFPHWGTLGLYALFAYAILVFGYWWFMRTKNGFADVL
ncbi:ABC transporter permease [Rhodanobacter sp. DHB23]|uniref:ABC transporter permease n=1 Tax=Rhodanobacter sp. DHB23 TaxID=2775923 RepID=UPI00177E766A|nr:ABC transporter permease [Rhodanobacter sp. DHB23]MBD8873280.1 ABC transporter permease [Rhodanobacter sp. DHB23]